MCPWLGLAGRFGLVSALARFAARLPAEDVDTDARRAVAQGMAATQKSGVLELGFVTDQATTGVSRKTPP